MTESLIEVLYSPKIKPEHLARKAIVYLRQSSEKQVRENKESRPERELFFLGASELPAKRSTSAITLLPKLVAIPMGLPSIKDFWMAS